MVPGARSLRGGIGPRAHPVRPGRRRDGSRRRPRATTASLLDGREPAGATGPDPPRHLAAEVAIPHPIRHDNSYPHAFEHLAQLFDHPSAPDLVVLHTAAHYWGDQGGHLGEHGSLGVVQARAPFIAAGAGVEPLGMVDGSCRLVDVAPTILALLGCRPPPGGRAEATTRPPRRCDVARARGRYRSGRPRRRHPLRRNQPQRALRPRRPRRGPNIARLMDMGTTYRYGAIASLPDGDPGQPHRDPHRAPPRPPRDPAQRVDRPGHRRPGGDQLADDVVDLHAVAGPGGARRSTMAVHRRLPGSDDHLDQRAVRRRVPTTRSST